MAWSIFTQGGGKPAAEQWAIDFLAQLGAPITPGNAQFVYDWQVSEGGGGKDNPLNQGPVTGHPELTTTGSQYGGGASDFASRAAGLTGAVDYVNYSNYAGVKAGLLADNPAAARAALIASPWASGHYGGGSGFSGEALPSAALPAPGAQVPAGPTSATTTSVTIPGTGITIPTSPGDVTGAIASAFTGTFKAFIGYFDNWAVRGLLIGAGAVAVIVGMDKLVGEASQQQDPKGASAANAHARGATTSSSWPAPRRGHPLLRSAGTGAAGAAGSRGAHHLIDKRAGKIPKTGAKADVEETAGDAAVLA